MVIGRAVGSKLSRVIGPSYRFCTCMLAKAGMISASGWSSDSTPSSINITVARPVIGFVME